MTGAMLMLKLGDSVICTCWAHGAAPRLLCTTCSSHPWVQMWTAWDCRSKFPPVQDPKHFSNPFLATKDLLCEVVSCFPPPLVSAAFQSLQSKAALHAKGLVSLCTLCRYAFQHSYSFYFAFDNVCSISQSWEIWPFTTTHAATSGARSGAVEYHGWDFQRCVRRCLPPEVFQEERMANSFSYAHL